MNTIKRTKDGIDYLIGLLKEKRQRITRAIFWKIHRSFGEEEISLKIGRYVRDGFTPEDLESNDPKSELTLDNEEFINLLNFISVNYEPFKKGVKKYIPIDDRFDESSIEHIRAFFENPERQTLLNYIDENNILPEDLVIDLQHRKRVKAIEFYEQMLQENQNEHVWQDWFTKNEWVLGSDFVKVLDERKIDTANIADYLMQAYDGFLDIVEIKRPSGNLPFWASERDHGNYVPSQILVKAITQATKYIHEVEREANSVKFLERVGNVKTIKPRCILIYGRSNEWNQDQREACRIMNSCYHNLTILTYDHVLSRAKRIVGIETIETVVDVDTPLEKVDDDLPF